MDNKKKREFVSNWIKKFCKDGKINNISIENKSNKLIYPKFDESITNIALNHKKNSKSGGIILKNIINISNLYYFRY